MALTSIEIIAFVVAILVLIKLLVILTNPRSWLKVTSPFYRNSATTTIVSLVLAVIVLFYLLQELTIVQIFGAMAFIALLGAMSVAIYSKELMTIAKKLLKDRNFLRKAWFIIIIWAVLSIWTLVEIFS